MLFWYLFPVITWNTVIFAPVITTYVVIHYFLRVMVILSHTHTLSLSSPSPTPLLLVTSLSNRMKGHVAGSSAIYPTASFCGGGGSGGVK